MKIPDWYQLAIVGIAAWRVFNLVAYDKILDRPRNWLLGLPWAWNTGDTIPDRYRMKWALWVTCPYCAGFWVGLVWFAAFEITSFWTTFVAIPFVLNAITIALAKILTPED